MSVLTKVKSSGSGETAKDAGRETLRAGSGRLGEIRDGARSAVKRARKPTSVPDRIRSQASEVAKGFSRPKPRSRGKMAAVAGAIAAAGAAVAYFVRSRIGKTDTADQPIVAPTDGDSPASLNSEPAEQAEAKA